jgi:cytochrome c
MARPALETGAAIVAAVLAAGALALVWSRGTGEDRRVVDRVVALTGGDPSRGRSAIMEAGCGACHEIPGVPGAYGRVGPSLASFGARVYVGGVATNTAGNLVRWIQHPRAVNPGTAMPDLGLDEPTARDIAAFLYAQTS